MSNLTCYNRIFSYEEAVDKFDIILKKFKAIQISQYDEFINILKNWRDEILIPLKEPFNGKKLSNSPAENINGSLRTYLTISKGIGNYQRFRKRVLLELDKDVNYALRANLPRHQQSKPKRGPYDKPIDWHIKPALQSSIIWAEVLSYSVKPTR